MKLKQTITPITAAIALTISALTAPITANADVSASMAFSNMYLWRGQNLSPNGAAISGSIDYGHESGFYAGIWTTSEDKGHETDLYLGYGREIGNTGFAFDISYWNYLYPEERTDDATPKTIDLGDSDAAELVFAASFGPATLTYYMQVDDDNDDDNYITLGVDFLEIMNVTYGMWDHEKSGKDEYSHLTFTYSPIDELSFAVSKASSDLSDDTGVEEDLLYQITYSKGFDLNQM